MIRSTLRSLTRLVAASILLALILCAVEVGFRVSRVRETLNPPPASFKLTTLVRPDATTYLEVNPLLDVEMPTSLNELTSLSTNEMGLRHGTVATPKPEPVYRVLLLGSSGVFGVGRPDNETISTSLRDLFHQNGKHNVQFLNAGCPNSGPLINFLRLRQRLLVLQPDLVVYCVSPDDLDFDPHVRGAMSLDENGFPAYAGHPRFTGRTSETVQTICEEFVTADWAIDHSGAFAGLTPSTKMDSVTAEKPTRNLGPFINFTDLCQSARCQLVISVLPTAPIVIREVGVDGTINPHSFERDLRTTFQSERPEVTPRIHNSIPLFEGLEDKQVVFDPLTGLLNGEGNTLYARSLAQFLVNAVPEILRERLTPEPTNQSPPTLPLPDQRSTDTSTSNSVAPSQTQRLTPVTR